MKYEYVKMSSVEDAEKYSAETGHWIVANVRQQVGWPEHKLIVYFRDVPLLFMPEKDNGYPAIAVCCKNGISEGRAKEVINHFLSSMSWSTEKPVEIECLTGGGRPYVMGKSAGCRIISKPFRIHYLPDTADKDARLALAFYREAMSLSHPAYSFLSYYKIINLKYKTGDSQKNWIEDKIKQISDWEAKKRIDALVKLSLPQKISEYLYHSCRCAIAHASVGQDVVNPEDYEDMNRLREDLPLIKSLAEMIIEEEFGILRPSTIYKTHPYELFGFKPIISDPVIEKIKLGESLSESIVFPEEVSVRLWGEPAYAVFESMSIEIVGVEKGSLVLQAISSDKQVAVIFALDFVQERIVFDPVNSIRTAEDNGSVLIVEHFLDISKFLKRYWANGILEIWDKRACKCLGYSDAFVPVNIDLARTLESFDQKIKVYEQELIRRKESSKVTDNTPKQSS